MAKYYLIIPTKPCIQPPSKVSLICVQVHRHICNSSVRGAGDGDDDGDGDGDGDGDDDGADDGNVDGDDDGADDGADDGDGDGGAPESDISVFSTAFHRISCPSRETYLLRSQMLYIQTGAFIDNIIEYYLGLQMSISFN